MVRSCERAVTPSTGNEHNRSSHWSRSFRDARFSTVVRRHRLCHLAVVVLVRNVVVHAEAKGCAARVDCPANGMYRH